jgi:hypothetical protein
MPARAKPEASVSTISLSSRSKYRSTGAVRKASFSASNASCSLAPYWRSPCFLPFFIPFS